MGESIEPQMETASVLHNRVDITHSLTVNTQLLEIKARHVYIGDMILRVERDIDGEEEPLKGYKVIDAVFVEGPLLDEEPWNSTVVKMTVKNGDEVVETQTYGFHDWIMVIRTGVVFEKGVMNDG